MQFQKEASDIPDCVRLDFAAPSVNFESILDKLKKAPTNSTKQKSIRSKWILYGRGAPVQENIDAWKAIKPMVDAFPCEEIGMVQISVMPPQTHLNIHYDGYDVKGAIAPQFKLFNRTMRIHIPLLTSERSFIYCAGKFYNLELNDCWMLNNMRKHSALNLNHHTGRYHLIFDVVPNEETIRLVEKGDASLGSFRPKIMEKLRSGNEMAGTNRPNFFVLNSVKNVAKPLFDYLHQHPDILRPEKQELHFYDHKIYGDWTLKNYLGKFQVKKRNEMSYDSTSYYFRHPHAPKWIRRDFPDAKFLVFMMNPIERAYVHYLSAAQKGKETRQFEDCIKSEDEFIGQDWEKACADETHHGQKAQRFSYLARSRYMEQLENWYESFPENRFQFVFLDDLARYPRKEMRKIFDFLGVPTFRDLQITKFKSKSENEALKPKTRDWLSQYFAPQNKRLAAHLGRELPW